MQSGHVTHLWRYPASSLGGELVETAELGLTGIGGDRRFGLVEVATGQPARPDANPKWHSVPRIKARLRGGSLEVAMPGGEWMPAPDNDCDRALSAFLGFDVALRPFTLEAVPPNYSGLLTEARYVAAPVHLLTTASLARLKALHPAGDPDPRRFRPNIVVDMPAIEGTFPETEWIGRRIAVGEVELTIAEPCRRCGFTIIAQDGFDSDPDILRNLVRHNGHNLGVYCTVDRPGVVRVGDLMRRL